jgi:TRAP-type C4-dicarboxylate transport system permease small subunit
MNVSFFVAMLPPRLRRIADLIAELLVALFGLFMVIWGVKLVDATWFNTIADFPALSVGVTYLPIPLGGAILLLFVIERVSRGQRTDVGRQMTEDASPKDQPSVLRPPSSVV